MFSPAPSHAFPFPPTSPSYCRLLLPPFPSAYPSPYLPLSPVPCPLHGIVSSLAESRHSRRSFSKKTFKESLRVVNIQTCLLEKSATHVVISTDNSKEFSTGKLDKQLICHYIPLYKKMDYFREFEEITSVNP